MTIARPVSWRQLSATSAAWSDWLRGGRQWVLDAPFAHMELFSARTGSNQPALRMEGEAGPIWLVEGDRWLAVASGIDVCGGDALADVLREVAVALLPMSLRRALQLGRPGKIEMVPDGCLAMTIRLVDTTGASFDCTALAPAARWSVVRDIPGWQPGRHVLPAPVYLPANLACSLGYAMVDRGALRQLRKGDVIVLTKAFFDQEGLGRLRVGARWLNVQLRDSAVASLKVLGWRQDGMNEQVQEGLDVNDTLPESITTLATIDALPVRLDFELGRLTTSFGTLATLAPGAILALEEALPPQVTIRAQGHAIGTGDVVEIDGKLAVRVVTLFHPEPA
ncbi:FliM/FliN family flagellar motor switch protein [Chitinivorax sp. B]|uniref:FliM/FliN family flagellar motor switch protein n=1 Tax=Chitinivorax sp. B TaxID=2502235 RepID=UPI0010F70007|nr:FliM/FliN family flagellar motor switch protein [Chitinivorax sp. B]